MSLNIDMTESFIDRVNSTNVYTVTKTTVDFEPVISEVVNVLQVAIQMAEPEDLKIEQLDWSKQYIWAFSVSELKMNQEVEFCEMRFKIVKLYNAKLYGYYKAICEEIKVQA